MNYQNCQTNWTSKNDAQGTIPSWFISPFKPREPISLIRGAKLKAKLSPTWTEKAEIFLHQETHNETPRLQDRYLHTLSFEIDDISSTK